MTRSVKTTWDGGQSVTYMPLVDYLKDVPSEWLVDIIEQWVTKGGKARVGGGAQPIFDIELTDPPSLFEAQAEMTKRYYITHTDKHGERHQLSGAWAAENAEAAIAAMLDESGSDDDGQWLAHEVTDEADVIE